MLFDPGYWLGVNDVLTEKVSWTTHIHVATATNGKLRVTALENLESLGDLIRGARQKDAGRRKISSDIPVGICCLGGIVRIGGSDDV